MVKGRHTWCESLKSMYRIIFEGYECAWWYIELRTIIKNDSFLGFDCFSICMDRFPSENIHFYKPAVRLLYSTSDYLTEVDIHVYVFISEPIRRHETWETGYHWFVLFPFCRCMYLLDITFQNVLFRLHNIIDVLISA